MKRNIIYLNLLLLTVFSGYAQNPYKGEIRVEFEEMTQNKETVVLHARIDWSDLRLGTNQMITFSPALRSLDGNEERVFAPFVLSGKQREKAMQRDDYFGNKAPGQLSGNFSVFGRKNSPHRIPLEISVPFEKWMQNSRMVIIEETSGCSNNLQFYPDCNKFKIYQSEPYKFLEPHNPIFVVSYLAAIAGEPKIMQETYSAQLNFRVNQTDLLRQYGNNDRVLREADEIIYRLRNDSLLTIRKILVRGYASPEGSAANNQRLSEGRARAFVGYLHNQYHFYEINRMIIAEGCGEDWDGLRKAVEQRQYLDSKERILNIIDNTYDPERRKSQIKALEGGRVYRMMLEELYPPLRRNEYTIEYEVRGFNAQEARDLFRTRPQLLSLEEMFMVANLYEHDSEEYKQVFDVAARIYPDSEIAQFNVGAMEIENGSYDTAIRRLEKFDTPEAWNNIGVACWFKGEYDKAEQYWHQASEAGNQQAIKNLSEFEKWQTDASVSQ